MFQTYAEVTGVSPSNGSVLGGTLLTIHGRFFDQTDQPARVLVGGSPCDVHSVTDNMITCTTAEHPMDDDMGSHNNTRGFPGSRGLRMEGWNNTRPRYLTDIWDYHDNMTGYWTQWIDAMRHYFPLANNYFSTRTRGFFVPPSTGNFTIYLHCDDICELYLSNSSRPEDKVKVAHQPYYVNNLKDLDSQRTEVLALEGGNRESGSVSPCVHLR
ncbi:hypothetical protein INR49_009289 [Caranx melampygus]|nr:hypothetical protein INR49_009289 [Caranx melampygus]